MSQKIHVYGTPGILNKIHVYKTPGMSTKSWKKSTSMHVSEKSPVYRTKDISKIPWKIPVDGTPNCLKNPLKTSIKKTLRISQKNPGLWGSKDIAKTLKNPSSWASNVYGMGVGFMDNSLKKIHVNGTLRIYGEFLKKSR